MEGLQQLWVAYDDRLRAIEKRVWDLSLLRAESSNAQKRADLQDLIDEGKQEKSLLREDMTALASEIQSKPPAGVIQESRASKVLFFDEIFLSSSSFSSFSYLL